MRIKPLIVIMLATGCGMGAAITVSQWEDRPSPPTAMTGDAKLFVSAVLVEEGEPLTPRHLRLERRPIDRVPDGAITRLDEFQGRCARQPLLPGQPVLKAHLRDAAVDPSEASTEVPRPADHDHSHSTTYLPHGEKRTEEPRGASAMAPFVVRVSMSVHPADSAPREPGNGDRGPTTDGWEPPTDSTVTGNFLMGEAWSVSSHVPGQPAVIPAHPLQLEQVPFGEAIPDELPSETEHHPEDFDDFAPLGE
jgi:hypothetical protein